jgi:hypothetical protein
MSIDKEHLKNLSIIGREFEQFGGMRVSALACWFDEEDPYDCLNEMAGVCYEALGIGLTEEGLISGDWSLEDICGACYDLRMEYGHGTWVSSAVLNYLWDVKSMDRELAITVRDRLLEASVSRFSQVKPDYIRRHDVLHIASCIQRLERMSSEMRGLQASIKRVVVELAPSIQFERAATT